MHIQVTVKGSPNIAFVKYWGKRDIKNNLPLNGSISLTLSSDDLYTETTVHLDDQYINDELFINEQIQDQEKHSKIFKIIDSFKSLTQGFFHDGQLIFTKDELKNCHVKIITKNSFPTAAGLASSASGFSCLCKCLSVIYNVYNKDSEQDLLNAIVRKGSGSACRSMYGGFVEWFVGTKDDGSDSIAKQLYPSSYWPDIRVIILINDSMNKEKTIKSTQGMNSTTETSELLQHRIHISVPQHLKSIHEALQNHDSEKLFKYIMIECNQFHAVCLDTYPPITYLNSISISIIHLITQLNLFYKHNIAAYTYDAGPNTFIFTTSAYYQDILFLLSHINIVSNIHLPINTSFVSPTMYSFIKEYSYLLPKSIYDVILTKGGNEPIILNMKYSTN